MLGQLRAALDLELPRTARMLETARLKTTHATDRPVDPRLAAWTTEGPARPEPGYPYHPRYRGGVTGVSIRELGKHGGEVVDRVARGEQITITRDGRPVAELRAIPRPALSAPTLLRRWRKLPRVDPVDLRSDIDELVDPGV